MAQNGDASVEEIKASMAPRYRMDLNDNDDDEFDEFDEENLMVPRPNTLPPEYDDIGEDFQSITNDYESTISDEILQIEEQDQNKKEAMFKLIKDAL